MKKNSQSQRSLRSYWDWFWKFEDKFDRPVDRLIGCLPNPISARIIAANRWSKGQAWYRPLCCTAFVVIVWGGIRIAYILVGLHNGSLVLR